MENNSPRKGFIPVMLTPFKQNGAIDFETLSQLTDLYIAAGASGLFANCLSSEMFELSDEERLAIIKHVVKHSRGLLPIVATGSFGQTTENQIDFIKSVRDAGAQTVILLANQLADENAPDENFNAKVYEILENTEDIALGFYECPVPYKRLLSAEQIGIFSKTGRITYHKDTCLDLAQIKMKISAIKESSNCKLYDAYMVHAIESLKAGSSGLSCIQGNYFPELIVWLCDNYEKNEALQVQDFLIKNMEVMHDVYPIASKYYLQKKGLPIQLFTRRKVGVFSKKIAQDMDTLFVEYEKLSQKLGIA
jgi:4-hydroxy-tetrahydrodipicolinate synthase